MKSVFAPRNWPYAYRNLQDSLGELGPHLKRLGLNLDTLSLKPTIDRDTPKELSSCIDALSTIKQSINEGVEHGTYGTSIEPKVTEMLLDRFVHDAQIFVTTLQYEIDINSSGLATYLNEDL